MYIKRRPYAGLRETVMNGGGNVTRIAVRVWNIVPSAGHESNIAQPKADKCPSFTSHFSPFNCCLSVVSFVACKRGPLLLFFSFFSSFLFRPWGPLR